MTFSLLAYDAASEKWGGAAATGNLCVGGWVLRGRIDAGLSASQGHAPSTLWGDRVLDRMQSGDTASAAVATVTGEDGGRDWRQLAALDQHGGTGAFTGRSNGRFRGHLTGPSAVASGNILSGVAVLEALVERISSTGETFEDRLIDALDEARRAGGDSRGLQSAALLVLAQDAPPLTLRVDFHEEPVEALRGLLAATRDPAYRAWLNTVPTAQDPFRLPAARGS